MVDATVLRREFLKFLPFVVLVVEGLALYSVPRALLGHPFPTSARVAAWPKPLVVTTRSFLCCQADQEGLSLPVTKQPWHGALHQNLGPSPALRYLVLCILASSPVPGICNLVSKPPWL